MFEDLFVINVDLKEKAKEQLANLSKAETQAQHNFNMLKQSLTDETKFANKDLAEDIKAKADLHQ
eukprot:3550409-Heterocapsa_arctica.AAC.1